MEIIVDNRITIKHPTSSILKWCRDNLVLDNPEYYKKERLGKWTGNIPKSIWLYENDGDSLHLPFGCVRDVWQMCMRGLTWRVQISPIRALKYVSSIKPYPYQEKAISAISAHKNGVLVMPCGSGKTQCGLEAIARIGGKALWLTHTQDLLNQSKKRAESTLDICGGTFGTITAGRVNIGSHITFATVQTMSKLDLSQYKDTWDIVIVDECQHCCGSPTKVTQFYRVVNSLSARYKIGLTATPHRADGLDESMFALLGSIIHEVERTDVEDTTCPVRVEQIQTNWMPDYNCVLMGDGTIDYHKVVENMTQDKERFDFVSQYVNSCGSGCLVLANRVEYLQRLKDRYSARSICLSGTGQSKKVKEERKEALRQLNDGEIQCVFATYQLAKEGLDVPNLRNVVFATPEKDETTVIQAVGRVGRKSDGKEYGKVVDFVDSFGMYQSWAKKRLGYYKKIGATIL